MEILYCEACGHRITETDQRSGVVRHETYVYCPKCVAAGLAPQAQALPVPEVPVPTVKETARTLPVASKSERRPSRVNLVPVRRDTAPAEPIQALLLRESQRAAAGHPPPSQKSLAIILLGVAAGATLAIGVLFVMATSKTTPQKEKVVENNTPEPALPRPQPQPVVTPDPPSTPPQPGPATPEVNPPATPVTPPTPEPPTPDPKTYVPSMMQPEKENIRETAAKSQLDKIKAFLTENPKERRLTQAMLIKFMFRSNNTEAAKEGEKMLAELKQADPLPADARPASAEADWNRAINLLQPIDLTKDCPGGRWRWKDNALIMDGRGAGKCELPYQPPEEYDYRLTFCRNSDNLLLQVLSVNKKPFAWIIGGQSGCCGFSRVAAREWDENATTTYLPAPLKSGQEYVSLIEVRKTGLRVFLDDKLVCEYKTDYQDLALQNDWHLRNTALLGIGSAGALTVYKIEVLEVAGVGKPSRSLQPVDPNQTTAPLRPSPELIVDYENLVAEAYGQVFKSGSANAITKIEEARKTERFSLLLPALDLDLELLRTCDDLRKHALDGAAALVDKRPFTFRMADGTPPLETGKNTERTVASVKESTIEIDHHVGGGAITVKADFDNFSPDTYYDLIVIGAPKTGEGALKTALAGFIAFQKTATAPLAAKIRAHLDAAKDDKLAAKVTQLRNRLAFYERDLGMEQALKKLDVLLKDKKWEDAHKAIEALDKDFGDTRAMSRLKTQFEQRRTDIDLQLLAAAVKTRGLFTQESNENGLIVIEAEHYHLKVDKADHSWVQVAPAGCSGAAAMQAQPNSGAVIESGAVGKAPRLDYRINVSKPGWFHLWIRGIGATGDDDSCHAGLDGVLVPTAADIVDFDATPTWSKSRAEKRQVASFEIKNAGLHTLNIWMREDGFIIDKLIMTRNGNYTVTGEGPAETLQKPPAK